MKHGFVIRGLNMRNLSHDNLAGLELFLFLLFFALFGWPIMTIVDKTHSSAIFMYLFLLWGILILLIALISRKLRSGDSAQADDGAGDS